MRPAVRNLIAVFVLAVVAMGWFGMVRDGGVAKADVSACPAVVAAADKIATEAPADPHASMWNQTLAGLVGRKIAVLVVQNPQCYDTQTVSNATMALAGVH